MRQIIFAICIFIPSTLFAQKAGDTVLVITQRGTPANLMSESNVVGTVDRGQDLRVDEVNGEWLWVNHRGTKGWINRRDVIHIDKAMDFFTAAIKQAPNGIDYCARGTV